MRFLFLLADDPDAVAALDPAERRGIVERHLAYRQRLADDGVLVLGEPISGDPPVRVDYLDGGPAQVIDGPFQETRRGPSGREREGKEHLGSIYVVDCADRDTALRYAADVPRSPGLTTTVFTVAD